MKSLRLLTVAALLTAAGTAMADTSVVHDGYAFDQNQLIPTGARLEVGTTGYGGALLWTANPYVGLALGYNGGDISWSDDLSVDGINTTWIWITSVGYLNARNSSLGCKCNPWAQGLICCCGCRLYRY